MKNNFKIFLFFIVFSSQLFCITPDWAMDAVWYQIFPERFYNGDHENDPDLESLKGTWPYEEITWWEVTPWTSDWYEFQPWEKANGYDHRYQFQWRRYGGDIQGIIDKLDYLKELGVNAIYLNPIFESPSSHKYGAKYFHHVDNNFGPDPVGDSIIWETESPENPDTWSNIRIATKYPNLTKNFFVTKDIQVEVIKLNGSVELAPKLLMCRRVVDLVSTGTTLKENGLKEIEKIIDVQSKLIVNRSAFKTKAKQIELIISSFRNYIK